MAHPAKLTSPAKLTPPAYLAPSSRKSSSPILLTSMPPGTGGLIPTILVVVGILMLGGLICIALFSCARQEFLPWCDDPKHPCPNVQPDYPPPAPMGAPRDAGADAR